MTAAVKCECQEQGVLAASVKHLYDTTTELPFATHAPGECKCTNDVKRYVCGDGERYLCSCCWAGEPEAALQ